MFNEALFNGSRELFYSFGIITTLLSLRDGMPSSFRQTNLLRLQSPLSGRTADEV